MLGERYAAGVWHHLVSRQPGSVQGARAGQKSAYERDLCRSLLVWDRAGLDD